MEQRNMDWYLDYWDDVIRQWFDGHIEESQQVFLDNKLLGVNPMHMPEPYWGDPNRCSIVIANYNPGGGINRDRHTYRDCACCPESFINQVKKIGYYNVVKNFPLILEPSSSCWWRDYGGSRWWKNKMQWIGDIERAIPNYVHNNLHSPFAIEFCGWHSPNWPANGCSTFYKKGGLTHKASQYFMEALTDSVYNSDAPFGICIGKQFFDLFTFMGIKHIDQSKNSQPTYNLHFFKSNGVLLLVLWGVGRNRYPRIEQKMLQDFLHMHIKT